MKSKNSTVTSFTRKHFTLLELITVIAIIAVLVGLLLPILKNVRDKALSIQCINNLRENLFSFISYANDFSGWMVVDSTAGTDKWPQIMSGMRKTVPCGDYLKLGKNKKRILCPATMQTMANNNSIIGDGNYYRGYGIQTPNTSSEKYQNIFFNTDYSKTTNMFIRAEKIRHPTSYPHLADTAKINGALTSEDLNYNKPGFRIWYVGSSVEGGIYMRHKGNANIAWIDGHVSTGNCMALTVLNIAHVDALNLFRHNFASATYDY